MFFGGRGGGGLPFECSAIWITDLSLSLSLSIYIYIYGPGISLCTTHSVHFASVFCNRPKASTLYSVIFLSFLCTSFTLKGIDLKNQPQTSASCQTNWDTVRLFAQQPGLYNYWTLEIGGCRVMGWALLEQVWQLFLIAQTDCTPLSLSLSL